MIRMELRVNRWSERTKDSNGAKERRQTGILIFFLQKKKRCLPNQTIDVCWHETDTNRYSLSNAAGIKE